MKKLLLISLALLTGLQAGAQLIETEPSIVTMGQPITVYFNSDEETGALQNFEGDLYAHTGVIIEGNSSWQKVIESWGNNTTQPQLTYLGNYRYELEITPSIEDFYPDMTGDENVVKLAFVFRNAAADKQTSDLFVDVFRQGLNVSITNPAGEAVIRDLNQDLLLEASATLADSLVLFIDDQRTYKSSDAEQLIYTVPADQYGGKWIKITAYDEPDQVSDSTYMYVIDDPVLEELPAGLEDGINYAGTDSVILVLTAPGKTNAFVLGDFNDWLISEEGYMKQTPDGEKFWLGIGQLTAGREYRFQYLVDGSVRIGDPYAEKVLDPWNDEFISEETYPDLIPYPEGKTTGLVTVLQTAEPEYEWTVTDFERPAKEDLVIYELLIRDFIALHDYPTLIDTLSYLDALGVNAIELMPVNEFDANLSWGYNPSYYLAPDKYYGTKNGLKAFIDSCHNRGIAVILDVVLNHSTGSSPMAALYWDESENNVTAENPWFNVTAKHDFNVFHDMNHESEYTRYFSKRVMQHWIEEYKVDGYRFDLSKGFTQTNTLGNTGAWGQYDASRVAIWKMYANYIWSMDSDFYVILEHFAENSEEKELAEYGMMLWGNMNHSYSQLSMGYDDSFDWGSYKTRGWSVPHLVSYMESHDEERMMYRNTTSGNSSGSYDIQNLDTGLERIILSAAMFFTVPGPKMLWQFGELGYDTSIDFNGRTGEKPIKWYYYDIDERKDIYDHFAALIKLKTENEAFRSDDFEIVDNGLLKRIKITDATMNVIVLGNFDVEQGSVSGDFHDTGWWYDYFKGDSLEVDDTAVSLTLEPGEFRIYTSVKLDRPELSVSVNDLFYGRDYDSWFNVYPNPVTDRLNIDLAEEYAGVDLSVAILDINGRQVYSSSSFSGRYINTGSLPRGMYFIRLSTPGATATRKFVKR
ncbi:MAG: T9SS type A sorting domain-containing protein [Bacteroidales bacterium]|nr:T9SS type A sorting domain-containing protein [Bacteroidales bacterium]